jgi:hypothetical protein
MAMPDPFGPGGACPCAGRCQAFGPARKLDGRSWDQDPTAWPRGGRGQEDAAQ